jgi:uncharacterized membrane-anchored protein
MVHKLIVIVAGVLVLALVNIVVFQRERLLEQGRVVLLELAPVDPRSLLQGDYMALEFRAALDARSHLAEASRADGALVVAVDERGVGRFMRRDDGAALGTTEVRLRYRVRDKRVRLVTNEWFFEEGRAEAFAKARYGEFRVAPDGEALLARMLDEKLQPLGGTPGR